MFLVFAAEVGLMKITQTPLQSIAFFSIWVLFHKHSRITWLQGNGEDIPLTPQYHFHLLHRYLDIGWVITAERSSQHIAQQPDSNWEPLVSERKSLTTKLRTLISMEWKELTKRIQWILTLYEMIFLLPLYT